VQVLRAQGQKDKQNGTVLRVTRTFEAEHGWWATAACLSNPPGTTPRPPGRKAWIWLPSQSGENRPSVCITKSEERLQD